MNRVLASLQILAHLADAVIAIDPEGRVLFWNDGAEKLYGWTSAEALGQSANELLKTRFVSPASSDRPLETLVDSLLREGRWQGELTRSSRTGEPIHVLSRWTILRDEGGASMGRLIIDTDLTEIQLRFHALRLAEERAREQAAQMSRREASLSGLIDGIADYAFMKDCDGRYLIVNAATGSFFGRQPSDIIGKTDYDLFPEEVARRLIENDRQVMASGGSLGFEYELPAAGGPNQVHTIKTAVRDQQGQVIGLVGISRDTRERKQLMDALRQHERDLTEAHRIAGIGTWRWVRATDTVTWSDEIYRIYGLDKAFRPPSYAELLARHELTPTEKLYIQAFTRAEQTGEPFARDMELRRPDGTTRWAVVRGEVETWDNGKAASLRGTIHEITERKRHEELLALSEKRYRSLVHASAQVVWTASVEGLPLGDLPEWQAFTGQSAAELRGEGWANAIHPDDRENSLHIWREAVRRGTVIERTERLRRHDGVYRVMEVRGAPVLDDNGSIVEWVGTHTDITEQAVAQERARTAHEELQHVLSSITDGLIVFDREWRYVYCNENAARMAGLRASDVVGKRMGEPFTTNGVNIFHRAYQRSMATGEPAHFEDFYDEPVNKWLECHCYPSASGLTVYFHDVTNRRRTDDALRASETRFRLLAEGIPQLVWLTDATGKLTYLNERFLAYIGIPAEAAPGFDWRAFIHPEDYDRTLKHWATSVAQGEPFSNELRLRRADGIYRHFLAHGLPLRNTAGELDHWVGSCTDLHDQKSAEEALRRSEKLAATGRLAASIAHEINNPLEAVTNSLWLALRDPNLMPETRKFLEVADQELARVAHITTQTLRFHKQSKSASHADLSDIMESVLGLFGPRLQARHIAIQREFEATATIQCFEDELRQVFANLVSNSLDATAEGGRMRIRIRKAFSAGP